jgi:hypothetical protein
MMLFFASAARAVFVLAVGLALTSLPALAQDAPPHEGEGQRRPAPVAKAAPAKAAPVVVKKSATKPAVKPGAKPGPKADAKPPLRSLDKNHDGRVTKDEFLAGSKKRFAKADANRDGVISPQEGKAAKAALKEKKAKRDAKRLAEGKPVKRAKPGAKPGKPYLSTLDTNKDGRVSQKEYLAAARSNSPRWTPTATAPSPARKPARPRPRPKPCARKRRPRPRSAACERLRKPRPRRA